jgi:hypothetical protein
MSYLIEMHITTYQEYHSSWMYHKTIVVARWNPTVIHVEDECDILKEKQIGKESSRRMSIMHDAASF